MTPFTCDECGERQDGYPCGGVGETVCALCWVQRIPTEAEDEEYREMTRDALCRCGSCEPDACGVVHWMSPAGVRAP